MTTTRSGRGMRHRQWWLAIALLPLLASCANARLAPTPEPTTINAHRDPELVVAACTASGFTLSSQNVSTTDAGVRFSVSSTGPAGTYVNFSWDGGGEGNPAPRLATEWIRPIPPGLVQVSCSTPAHEWPAQTVTVSDDGRHWSPITLSDLACPPGISPGWAISKPGRGASAEVAIREMLRHMEGTDWSHATQTKAPIGYPDAPVQTWIVALSGRPEISATVTQTGVNFEASPDTICHA